MADKYYFANLGASSPGDVTKANVATPGAAFEVRVTYDATGVNKADLVKALTAMRMKAIADTWPPA